MGLLCPGGKQESTHGTAAGFVLPARYSASHVHVFVITRQCITPCERADISSVQSQAEGGQAPHALFCGFFPQLW